MKSKRLKRRALIYIAGPLFSEAELAYNLKLADVIEEHLDAYLPQRDGGKLVDLVSRGVSVEAAYSSIYERDIEALREADAILILLDGRTVDEGAAFELGFAAALSKDCFGLQTDPRRLLMLGNNPMIQVPLRQTFGSLKQVAEWAQSYSPVNCVYR